MKWLHCRMLSFFGPVADGLLAVAPGNAHEAAIAPRPTDAAPASRSRRLIVLFHKSPMNTSLSAAPFSPTGSVTGRATSSSRSSLRSGKGHGLLPSPASPVDQHQTSLSPGLTRLPPGTPPTARRRAAAETPGLPLAATAAAPRRRRAGSACL